MTSVALAAKLLDRVAPDETESLGFVIVARHRASVLAQERAHASDGVR